MSQEVTVNVKVTGADKGAKQIEKLGKATKNVSQDAKEMKTGVMDAWGEVDILGTNLGSVGKAFTSTAKTAKLMFTSIKVGLISTGIGAFIVAIGSLVSYFTSTQRGAEKLEIAMAKLGATFTVIKDRVSNFGEGLLKLFKKGEAQEGLSQMKDSFKGIGEEIKEDVKLMGELTQSAIELRKAEREINLETAKRRAEIEQLKLIAEDQTKSIEERLVASEKAFKVENDILAKRVSNAQEAVRIQKEQMALSENLEEDKEKLTQLEISLSNIQQESFTKQIELNNKLNAIRKEGESQAKAIKEKEEQQRAKDQKQRDAELESLRVANLTQQELELSNAQQKFEKLKELAEKHGQDTTKISEFYNQQVLDINKKYAKKEEETEEMTQKAKVDIINQGLSAITGALGENSKVGKGVAIAQALMNTYQGITNALANVPAPFNLIQAGATAVAGMTAVRNIMKTDPENPSVSDAGGGEDSSTAPTGIGGNMFGGSPSLVPNQLTEQLSDQTQEPVQAYVVETDISSSQALQEELNLQTTL